MSVRTAHPLWGGRRIAKELKAQGLTNVPAPSTITSILTLHGMLHQDKCFDRLECLFADHQNEPTPLWTVQPVDESDLAIVREHLLSKRVLERRRAIVVLATWRGLRPSFICKLLRLRPVTYRRCVQIVRERGVAALFDRRKNAHRKYDNEVIKNTLFDVLHQPPSNFGINRTTWKMADLSRVLNEKGHAAGEDVIRKIAKAAGYRWRRARKKQKQPLIDISRSATDTSKSIQEGRETRSGAKRGRPQNSHNRTTARTRASADRDRRCVR